MKILIAIFLFPSFVFANTYYVSSNGSDGNNGLTISTPWQTLNKVQNNVSVGDSVLFSRGSKFTGTLSLNNKNDIFFGSYGTGRQPLFWGTGSNAYPLINVSNCYNITFYNILISDTTISPTDRTIIANIKVAIQIENNSNNVLVRKCTMDRVGYGVYITGSSSGQWIDSCDVGNLRMVVNTPGGDDDFGAIPVQLSSSNNSVSNNYFHDCYAVSYDYIYDGGAVEFFSEDGSLVQNNIVIYNTIYDCNGCFEFGANQVSTISRNTIAYNKIINSSSFLYVNNSGIYEVYIQYSHLYNNIFIQTATSRTGETDIIKIKVYDPTDSIIEFKNNIFWVTNGANIFNADRFNDGQLVHQNNMYKTNGNLNITLNPSEYNNISSPWVDITNTNPLYWDYNIPITSLANNNGTFVDITRDFNDNVVDNPPSIGILEYAEIPPTPPVIINKILSNKKFTNSLP